MLLILGSLEIYIPVNWTFSLGVTAEALRVNIDRKSQIEYVILFCVDRLGAFF